ncbi:hypothetical protein [Polaromonas sp.]|uniref:hypothetical protein n=1 Tax=Polaromonas sp. TaxID=1869339 RepID=UPI0013BCCE3B|nr:hypothetical protein [Polaromonas sp.]NDP64778.1 hypothetical protein [Polaromonas sp.]
MHLPPIFVSGAAIDLTHLASIQRNATIEVPVNIKKTVPVEFVFSCHCYSRRLKPGEIAPHDQFIREGDHKAPRNRVFDQTRYDLSKKLVTLLDELIQTNGEVSKTKKHNFFRVTDDGTGTQYFIIMHAKKISEPNRPKSFQVIVESAYPDDPTKPSPHANGGRTFGQMLGEKWI